MKKPSEFPLTTFHALVELATLSRIVQDAPRKGELLKGSRTFESLVHCVASSIRGYRPHRIMYDDQDQDENIFELMEGAAALLGLLSLIYKTKNFSHIAGRRIAIGTPRIDSLKQVIELNQKIERYGGNLSVIVCLSLNRDHSEVLRLQQSPKRIICVTSVDPYEPSKLYLAPPIKPPP